MNLIRNYQKPPDFISISMKEIESRLTPQTRPQLCLSRLSIVGLLGPDTPVPVVEEIALAHGIQVKSGELKNNQYFLQMIQKIHKTPIQNVSEPFSYRDYILISKFINPYMDPRVWPELRPKHLPIYAYPNDEQGTLRSSLTRYFGFRFWSGFESLDVNFQLGLISPTSPNNIDVCILFRYCSLRGLTTNRSTTIREMEALVRMDLQGDLFFLQQQIISAMSSQNLSRRSLINALHSLVGSSIPYLAGDFSPQNKSNYPLGKIQEQPDIKRFPRDNPKPDPISRRRHNFTNLGKKTIRSQNRLMRNKSGINLRNTRYQPVRRMVQKQSSQNVTNYLPTLMNPDNLILASSDGSSTFKPRLPRSLKESTPSRRDGHESILFSEKISRLVEKIPISEIQLSENKYHPVRRSRPRTHFRPTQNKNSDNIANSKKGRQSVPSRGIDSHRFSPSTKNRSGFFADNVKYPQRTRRSYELSDIKIHPRDMDQHDSVIIRKNNSRIFSRNGRENVPSYKKSTHGLISNRSINHNQPLINTRQINPTDVRKIGGDRPPSKEQQNIPSSWKGKIKLVKPSRFIGQISTCSNARIQKDEARLGSRQLIYPPKLTGTVEDIPLAWTPEFHINSTNQSFFSRDLIPNLIDKSKVKSKSIRPPLYSSSVVPPLRDGVLSNSKNFEELPSISKSSRSNNIPLPQRREASPSVQSRSIIPIVPLFDLVKTDNSLEDSRDMRLTKIHKIVNNIIDKRIIPETESEMNRAVHQKLKELRPNNQINAIILAAVLYQIDISSCLNPLLELRSLSRYGGNIEQYQPIDANLKERIKPDRLKINGPIISLVFNPQLPRALYLPQTLNSLALGYGYTEENISVDDPYYLLQMSILTDHFYQGKPKTPLNRNSPIELDRIDNLSPWEYISYGHSEKGYNIIKYSELNDLFRRYGYFRYPKANSDDPDVYSRQSIKRLTILLLLPSYQNEPEDSINLRHNLALKIHQIIQEDETLLPAEKNLRNKYRENDKNHRIIRQLMNKFLDITMKMRGWAVVDKNKNPIPYPIIHTPVDNPFQVEVRVTDAIGDFDRFCGKHEECSRVFLKYPLFKYRGGYVRSNDIDDGFTIQDRINIVRFDESITACIRLTSNWFGATHSKMSTILGIDQAFNIKQLRNIG